MKFSHLNTKPTLGEAAMFSQTDFWEHLGPYIKEVALFTTLVEVWPSSCIQDIVLEQGDLPSHW